MLLVEEPRAGSATDEAELPSLWHPRLLIKQGRHEEALLELSTAVYAYPDWAEPWVLVGQAMSLRCKFEEALEAVERALDLEPAHVWAHELATGLLLQLERRPEALDAARRLVATSPHRAESHAFLAFAAAFNGLESEALAAARRCRRMAPSRGVGHQAMCVVFLAFGRWSRAEHHARQVIAVDGPVASVYHDLAVALFEQGRFDEARSAMQQAVVLDERYEGAAERLARRRPRGVPPVLSMVALAAGIAAVPLGNVPVAYVAVAVLGVAALVVMAARQTGASMSLHPDKLRVALIMVLTFDLATVAQQLGVLPPFPSF